MRKPRSRSAHYVQLQLNRLEDRCQPATGLNVSLSGGILRITDWRPSDVVGIFQTTSGITLHAAGEQQVYTGVARVIVDVQSTASVTNNVAGLNGAAARSVYLTRRDASGQHIASSGSLAAGATSGPAAPTTPAPQPPAPQPPPPVTPPTTWFDAAIGDGALRTLARSLAADGVLSRNDWLRFFDQVGRDGTVNATEFNDLGDLLHPGRAVFSAAIGFTLPEAIRVLAGKVVDGDAANARYQGSPLGNLQAGSTSTQLQKLVGKWFLGTDRPIALAGAMYRQVNGSLFVNGPSYADVRQGAVGDCYYVAALAEFAQNNPQALRQMFTDNGDGTFTIRFYRNGQADYVTVDRYLPTNSSGSATYASFGGRYDSTSNELWVALAEKAYAQINESGWLGRTAGNSYAAIDGGYSDLAMEHLTGVNAGWRWMQNSTVDHLVAAARNGTQTVLASKPGNPGNNLVASHGYALIAYNATTGRFTLYNPWGSTIELTWQQIQQSFNGYWQAGL